MANLRRRSARLSKASGGQPSARKTPVSKARLGSLVERDETPDAAQQSIDEVLATPTTSRTAQDRPAELVALRTPQTEPKPDKSEMDPKTTHRSTTKAPDSGLKLGFSDIRTTDKKNDTPSKSASRPRVPAASSFEFNFSSEAQLSDEAQKLMDTVREDAARIKAQMLAEKSVQEQRDSGAEKMFGAGRRIAQPKGKAGRFSDIHMAQFKKMDSIANHASAFRAKPGFAAPTSQSLKRSPSKAGLDEAERPKTAGKLTPGQSRRIPPPVTGRPQSVSPFRSINAAPSRSTPGPAKRIRHLGPQSVSESTTGSAIPKPKSSLYSPTKASLSRTGGVSASPKKSLPSTQSIGITSSTVASDRGSTNTLVSPPKSHPVPQTTQQQIEYPNLPESPLKQNATIMSPESKFTSRLPTLSGLRSILRGRREVSSPQRPGTPKRLNTTMQALESAKKVDFTPSVKSRYAVKLAADSPSPAKIRRDTPFKASAPVIPYDSSAWIIEDEGGNQWEDESTELTYPTLPPHDPSDNGETEFSSRAKEHNRRESKEFKSIFTNLHPTQSEAPSSLTSINTVVNKTDPEAHALKSVRFSSNTSSKPSPSTIRRVPASSTAALVQPFEDKMDTVPHGLPDKKRRHDSANENEKFGHDEDAKENRQLSGMPTIPGGWDDPVAEELEHEEDGRTAKRTRVSKTDDKPAAAVAKPVIRKSAARETAAKNAKERKGRGALSLSRLNMLSRPKTRG